MTRMETRSLGEEIYLTGTSDDPHALVARAREALAEHDAEPMFVKAYGPPDVLAKVLGFPSTILDSRFVGLQVWGVPSTSVTAVESGRLWSGSDFRVLHLSSLRGDGGGACGQAKSMFAKAAERLALHGFGWNHAARTWIYLARLLEWYREFNGVRTEVYRRAGLTGFPASTGIQGHNNGEECLMDLLAVEGLTVRWIRATPRQNEAFSYGSAFSRGAVIERGKHRTIHISGTASIDAEGRTIYLGDPEAQLAETLRNIAALLALEGARLEDVVTATLFCKDAGVLERCVRIVPFPFVPVIADVCRPDLLVEIEAIAAV